LHAGPGFQPFAWAALVNEPPVRVKVTAIQRTAMYHRNHLIEQTDPEIFAAIQAENARQEHHIELIASENYASPAVMAAQGSQLTNKYAEGYPGKRYYGGCEHVDVAEQLAIDRIKQILWRRSRQRATALRRIGQRSRVFGFLEARRHHHGHEPGRRRSPDPRHAAEHVGQMVQRGVLRPGRQEAIDYEAMEAKARETKPKLIIAGASAYSLHIDWARFAKVAKEVGAIFLVDMAHYAGLIAAGVYPNPCPTLTWSPPPHTRACAAHAAASS
jgi:glycine hydroxymethyltransferase